MGEGPHLGAREAGVGVAKAQPPQAEPLVRTLEVALDLRGGEQGPRRLGRHALGRGRDERALPRVDAPCSRGDLFARDGGGATRRRRVLGEKGLGSGKHGPLAQGTGDLVRRGLRAQAVAGHDLGEHDGGVALPPVRAEERALQHERAAGRSDDGGEARALGLHGARGLLDAPGAQDVGARIVPLGDGGLDRGLAQHEEGVDGGGGEAARGERVEDADRGAGGRGRALRAQDDARPRERLLRERHELGERHGAGPLGISRDAELLQRASNVENRPQSHHRLARGGRGGGVTLHVGHEQLGGGGAQPPAQQLACRGGNLRGHHALGAQLSQEHGGHEQPVRAPLGVQAPRPGGVHVRDVRDQEVGELAGRPPGHVPQLHAHGAGPRGIRDRGRRGPRAGKLAEPGDAARVAEEGPARPQLHHGARDLRADGNATGDEARRELAPGALGVRGHHHDVGAALPDQPLHRAADELRLGRGAGRQQHPHRPRGRERELPGTEERAEEVGELGGAGVVARRVAGRDDGDVRRLGKTLRERALGAAQPGEARKGDGRDLHARLGEGARQLVHDLAELDETRGAQLVTQIGDERDQRALGLGRAVRARPGVCEPRQAHAREVREKPRGPRRVGERGPRAPAGAREHAPRQQVAREAVHGAPPVPPDLPALGRPGCGRAHGRPEREAPLGEGALDVERLGEAGHEHDRPPPRRQRGAHPGQELGRGEPLVCCCEGARRHGASRREVLLVTSYPTAGVGQKRRTDSVACPSRRAHASSVRKDLYSAVSWRMRGAASWAYAYTTSPSRAERAVISYTR